MDTVRITFNRPIPHFVEAMRALNNVTKLGMEDCQEVVDTGIYEGPEDMTADVVAAITPFVFNIVVGNPVVKPLDTDTYEFTGSDVGTRSVAEACNQIDAAMFSSDTFLDKQMRQTLRNLMARWERGSKEWDRIDALDADPTDGEDQ